MADPGPNDAKDGKGIPADYSDQVAASQVPAAVAAYEQASESIEDFSVNPLPLLQQSGLF